MKRKLWNKDTILMLQGNAVSALGGKAGPKGRPDGQAGRQRRRTEKADLQ